MFFDISGKPSSVGTDLFFDISGKPSSVDIDLFFDILDIREK